MPILCCVVCGFTDGTGKRTLRAPAERKRDVDADEATDEDNDDDDDDAPIAEVVTGGSSSGSKSSKKHGATSAFKKGDIEEGAKR